MTYFTQVEVLLLLAITFHIPREVYAADFVTSEPLIMSYFISWVQSRVD